jgi:hypothetical protein
LRVATFVGEQSSQDFFSNRMFGGIQRAVIAPLRDSSQTVAESVLISRGPDLPANPAMGWSLAHNNQFCRCAE